MLSAVVAAALLLGVTFLDVNLTSDVEPDLSYRTLDYDVMVLKNGDLKVTQHIDMKLNDRGFDWKQMYQQYTLKANNLTNISDISVKDVTNNETYIQGRFVNPNDVTDWNAEHAGPVSYTHLDVYKRQLTGHAKGGACIFQVNGLTQLFKSGVVPANAALDCVDPKLKRDDHMVWLREPLKVGSVKAGLATSLGFGHVSGFAAIVNPGAFEASVANTVGEDALNEWRDRANARLAAGQRRLEEGMMGRAALYLSLIHI